MSTTVMGDKLFLETIIEQIIVIIWIVCPIIITVLTIKTYNNSKKDKKSKESENDVNETISSQDTRWRILFSSSNR